MQLVGLVHDTLESDSAFGSATSIDQAVPFHRSISGFVPFAEKLPTATQFVALEHDTPKKLTLLPEDGAWVATSAQLTPSHRIAIGEVPPALWLPPTAKQFVLLEQETPYSPPLEFATTAQLVPFHRSITPPVRTLPLRSDELPTAKQFVELVHDTPMSIPPTFGLGTSSHLVPFHCSMSGT
jgi:hypothetical protein